MEWFKDLAAGIGLMFFVASAFVFTSAAHALMAG
jgi:hypothetical protein